MKTAGQPYPEHLRNQFAGSKVRVGIIVSRFHEEITKALALAAIAACREAGLNEEQIELHYVPGAFEIPQVAGWLAASHRCQALVCLGAIIKGDTNHHQDLANALFPALVQTATQTGVPIGVGVLTTDNQAQALARAGGELGNKGMDAACAALELLEWKRRNEHE